MRVKPSQLIPGCILLEDVIGKSNHPIMSKDTVLTDQHIIVLKKFLVEEVNVSSKLSEGKTFVPIKVPDQETKPKEILQKSRSFHDSYKDAITTYKRLFQTWKNNLPINMTEIRNMLYPLLQWNDLDKHIYMLHRDTPNNDLFYHHSIITALFSTYLAKKMNYPLKDCLQIGLAAFLCDCGMAKIKNSTADGQKEIENHPTYSYQMIKNVPTITEKTKLAVLQHHERIDGSGYPLGLKGNKIHHFAKIIAVCDTYTLDRLQNNNDRPFQGIEKLYEQKGFKLDPTTVPMFIRHVLHYSIGNKVRLTNNKMGTIKFMNQNDPTRPMIQLDKSNEIISLQQEENLHIYDVVLEG